MTRFAMSLMALLLLGLPAMAQTPAALDADAIMTRMKAAIRPAPPSTRTWEIRLSTVTEGVPRVVRAVQARSRDRVVTVVTSPDSLRGTAFMIDEQDEMRWVYAPVIDRVRRLVPVLQGEAFLHSDFTYGDLGFVSTGASYELMGQDERNDVRAYHVTEVPASSWYYSRIETWVAVDTFLPVQREFYDSAGRLWKVATFANVQLVDNRPTPLHIRMEDVQAKTSTDILVSDVQYNASLPDGLFEPSFLPRALTAPGLDAVAQRTSQLGTR